MEGRKARRLVTRIIVGLVLIGLFAFVAKGFVAEPIPVTVGKVGVRSLEVAVEESGKTRVRARYVVSAPVLGSLARVGLKVGDSVEAGAVVAEIAPMAPGLLDDRTRGEASARVQVAQANIDRTKAVTKRAETTVAFARDQAERQRALRASRGTSEQALEQANFTLHAAEEDLAAAVFTERVAQQELALARTAVASMSGGQAGAALVLTAPASGRVLRVLRESEGVVQAGTPLVEIGDPRGLEIVVDVLTTDAVKIVPGAEASIERWGGDRTLKARVRSKEPAAFTTRSALGVEEQRVAVLLDLLEPPEVWAALGDAFRVETRIRTAFVPDALVAPAGAVFRRGEAWAAFVMGPEGKAVETILNVGARTPDWVEIKRGLSATDRLVLYPSDQVVHGSPVVAMDGEGDD